MSCSVTSATTAACSGASFARVHSRGEPHRASSEALRIGGQSKLQHEQSGIGPCHRHGKPRPTTVAGVIVRRIDASTPRAPSAARHRSRRHKSGANARSGRKRPSASWRLAWSSSSRPRSSSRRALWPWPWPHERRGPSRDSAQAWPALRATADAASLRPWPPSGHRPCRCLGNRRSADCRCNVGDFDTVAKEITSDDRSLVLVARLNDLDGGTPQSDSVTRHGETLSDGRLITP